MRIFKTALLTLMLLITVIFICSCGGEPVKTSLNYERPIIAIERSVDALDNVSYLNCFTLGAKQAYMESDNYNPELVSTLLPSQTASKRLFKAKVTSAQPLEQEDITMLEQEYKDKYKKRINISKAQKLNVEFGTMLGNNEKIDSRELIAVRIETEWYIYGDVIESLNFGVNIEHSKTAS